MKSIDKDVLVAYNSGVEKNSLRAGLGLIEFERTKEIIQQIIPPAPAVIYDIGGGYGEYSFWLSSLGYEVYLYQYQIILYDIGSTLVFFRTQDFQ